MNNLKIIIFYIVAGLFFASGQIQAQTTDREAIAKDMTILKGVLEEIFQTEWKAHGSRVRVHSTNSFSLFGSRGGIQNTYIPGYGMTFIIEGGRPAFVIFSDEESGNKSSFVFQNSFDSTTEQVNKESIISRIKSFLKDYGATAGSLASDEHITVMYKNRNYNERQIARIRRTTDEDESVEILPNISITAKKANLKDFQSGKLSEDQLEERISVSTSEIEESSPMDVRIMANILKTASNEQSDNSAFSGSRLSTHHLLLDDFGVLYFMDYSTPLPSPPSPFKNSFESLDVSFDTNEPEAIADSLANAMKKQQEKMREEQETKQQTREDYYRSRYEDLIENIKTTLADYGHTLKSIKPDQQVMIAVDFSSRFGNIPKRINISVDKHLLDDVASGKTDREQVFDQIVVREY